MRLSRSTTKHNHFLLSGCDYLLWPYSVPPAPQPPSNYGVLRERKRSRDEKARRRSCNRTLMCPHDWNAMKAPSPAFVNGKRGGVLLWRGECPAPSFLAGHIRHWGGEAHRYGAVLQYDKKKEITRRSGGPGKSVREARG